MNNVNVWNPSDDCNIVMFLSNNRFTGYGVTKMVLNGDAHSSLLKVKIFTFNDYDTHVVTVDEDYKKSDGMGFWTYVSIQIIGESISY